MVFASTMLPSVCSSSGLMGDVSAVNRVFFCFVTVNVWRVIVGIGASGCSGGQDHAIFAAGRAAEEIEPSTSVEGTTLQFAIIVRK